MSNTKQATTSSDAVETDAPTRKRRPRQTRAHLQGRLIEVGTKLFAEQGYSALTTREIAQHADMALAVLYRFFVDKRDLYIQCCREAIEKDIVELNTSVEDLTDNQEIIYNFASALMRRRTNNDIPHIVMRAVFDGDAGILESQLRDLFAAAFFQKTLSASVALSDDERAYDRVLYIYSLTISLPRWLPLWDRNISGAPKRSDTSLTCDLLKTVYPALEWDHLAQR